MYISLSYLSALTNTISNFCPDSFTFRYDSTNTRVRLRHGGHCKRTHAHKHKHTVFIRYDVISLRVSDNKQQHLAALQHLILLSAVQHSGRKEINKYNKLGPWRAFKLVHSFMARGFPVLHTVKMLHSALFKSLSSHVIWLLNIGIWSGSIWSSFWLRTGHLERNSFI